MKTNTKFIKLLNVFFAIAVMVFVIIFLKQNFDDLADAALKIDLFMIGISFVILLAGFLITVYGWKKIFHMMGAHIPFVVSLSIVTKSQLIRYVPGYIFPYISKIYLTEKEGIVKSKIFTGLYLERVLIILSGILMGVFCWPWIFGNLRNVQYLPYVAVLLFICAAVSHPRFINLALRLSARIFKEKSDTPQLSYMRVLFLLTVYLLMWATYGVGYFFIIKSIYPISINMIPFVAGVASISWIAGFLFLIAPGGIGVREGVAVLLFNIVMPLRIAVISAVMARIALTFIELSSGAFVFFFSSRKTKSGFKAGDSR